MKRECLISKLSQAKLTDCPKSMAWDFFVIMESVICKASWRLMHECILHSSYYIS